MKSEEILQHDCFSKAVYGKMSDIIGNSLQNINISVFEFLRVYDNGKVIMLHSHENLAKFVIQQQIPVTADVPGWVLNREFWYIPCEESNFFKQMPEFLRNCREIAGVGSFINYIVRSHGYYDMFCFFSQKNGTNAVNQFINSRQRMQNFCLEFYKKIDHLVLDLGKKTLYLHKNVLPNFNGLTTTESLDACSNLSYAFEKIKFEIKKINKDKDIKMSERELQCLHTLIMGKTAKDIACQLQISPRTVEGHLEAIKIKLGCRYKTEIISKMLAL